MRKFISGFLLAVAPCFAAITNIQATDATPREVILRYTAPSPAACTIEVSESSSFTPLVNDVNPSLFAGSNSDFRNGTQGRARAFILGAAGTGINYAPVDLTAKRSSRALQTNTLHYYRLTCGADVASGTFSTANIAPGDTFPAQWPIDPATPGASAWPFLDWNANVGVIDPVTGVFVQRFIAMNAQRSGYDNANISATKAYDASANWTSPNNATGAADTALATFTGSTNNSLLVTFNTATPLLTTQLIGMTAYVTGGRDSVGTTAEMCLTVNGATCYGPYIPITGLVTTGVGLVTVGDQDTDATYPGNGSPSPGLGGVGIYQTASMMAAWLSAGQDLPNKYSTSQRSGFADNTGAVLTLRATGVAFDPAWTTGTHITYGGNPYTIASVQSGSSITLSTAPATNTGNTAWSADNIGFLIRKSSVGGTLSIDSVVLKKSGYNSQVTNGGSGGSKQCSSKRYPQGWRIGGPVNTNYNAATNTAPIVMMTTTPNDYITGDVVIQANVPNNTAANGTWTITRLTASTYSLNGSDGTASGVFPRDDLGDYHVFYYGGGVTWKVNAPTGFTCGIASGDSTGQGFWINPDTTPATVAYLGPAYINNVGLGWANGPSPGGSSDESGALPLVYSQITISGNPSIAKGVGMGQQNIGMNRNAGNDTVAGGTYLTNNTNWSIYAASPNGMSDKLTAFDATATGLGVSLLRTPKLGKVAFSSTLGIQNTLGWIGIYDVASNSVVALMNTWKNANSRWSGLHTALAWEGADYYSWVPYELLGYYWNGSANIQETYAGPYRMHVTSGAISIATTACSTQFTALSIANPLNATGNICTTLTVDTTIPITPPTFTPANDTLNNLGIRIGDRVRVFTSGGGPFGLGNIDNEIMKIVGFSGFSIIFQRDAPVAHAATAWLHMFADVVPRWWDWVNAPHGETGTDPYSQGLNGNFIDPALADESHYFTRNSLSVADVADPTAGGTIHLGYTCASKWASAGQVAEYSIRNYPWPNHVTAPDSAYGCVAGNPLFSGASGNGLGDYLEKHPSPVDNLAVNPSFFDARPYATGVDWQQTVTKVGTYIYKVTSYGQFGAFNEKRNMLYVAIGHRTARDVSGPSVLLADTSGANYTYCLAHVAGECWAASSIGDVYVNAPFVAKVPIGGSPGGTLDGTYSCNAKNETFSDNDFNDICVGIQAAYGDYILQYSIVHDPFNTGARRISNAFHMVRGTDSLWNTPVLPDGNWAIAMVSRGEQGGGRQMMKLVKIPPFPGIQRGTNRGDFLPIPVSLTSVPAGTNNVLVEFGYTPSFQCSTRQESCIANAATIPANAYSYSVSDTYSGLACSSRCTPMIPALSQRIMWYRVKYRNSSNQVINIGDVQTIATP